MYNGKIIVVTGASSGIGLCTALEAQKRKAKVVWASRAIEDNPHIIELLDNGSIAKDMDVTDENSVLEFFKIVDSKYGRIDALINCAGYVEPESMVSTTLYNWNKTISTNLTGTFLCCRSAVNLMKLAGGTIVNIASTSGLSPRPGWSAYAAAKSGVINFSLSLAQELAEYNIRIFIICPGRTATPLRKILAPLEDPNTIMQAETVAKNILYCLTDEAEPLEGQPIQVRERF
mgnify:CR=1 FL=1